jgi:hypothetical protein
MSTVFQENPPTPKTPPEIYYAESDGQPMAETDIHRDLMNDSIKSLQFHFENKEDVYVTGNIMFYTREGDPTKVTSPDLMVVRGVKKEDRRVFKLWEEKPPVVVIEFSSRKTWKEDLQKKWKLYQDIGVSEYYIFDPEYDYLEEPLLAYKLINGELVEVEVKDRKVYSEALELELVDTGVTLRFFDPKTGGFIPTPLEEHKARLYEQEARQRAEEELTRLRAELERLKNK